jgi:transposase-like protein
MQARLQSVFQGTDGRRYLAVCLRLSRFPLSLRNVEDLLHERGIDITHDQAL